MEQFHGTNISNASAISSGLIDVTKGGGELGQGFYTGDLVYEAFTWAWHQYKQDKAVVKFNLNDEELLALDPLCLKTHETKLHRENIRKSRKTRTFKFFKNVIWAPVVGKNIHNFNQFKYESTKAQDYLNGHSVNKTIY
jgi:hypothetical protein